VAAAIEQGYEGVAICRNSKPRPDGVRSIADLREILRLI
jgi:hypothetical protein